jgi:2-iminobutanoate/2-iminopropanoate deaminase
MKTLSKATCLLAGLGLATTSALADHHESDVEYLHANNQVENTLPFSDAVRVGDVLYVSGKIGNVPGTMELAPGGIQGETRQALQNIKTSVERYGFSMSKPIKCTVFLADIAEWAKMNEIYVQFFPENKPARSAFGASGIALAGRVEIECMFAR